MEATQPKSITLIVARQLAENLATPMFLVDGEGMLVFYNEAAESIVGQPFSALGEISVADWGAMLEPCASDGTHISRAIVPTGVAFLERRPAHMRLQVKAFDGVHRHIEMTAYPLFGRADEFAGVVSIFWETAA